MKLNSIKLSTTFLLMFLVFCSTFLFSVVNIKAEDTTTTKIKITKIWNKDEEEVRPDNITVHLKKTTSTLITGEQLSVKMKTLAGNSSPAARGVDTTVKAFIQATKEQYDSVKSTLTTNNEIQTSGEKTYMWNDGGTIYYYSLADNVYLNANSNSMFSKMYELIDISGAANLNTTYATSMAFMFEDCRKLTALSALKDWNVSNVTTMRFMFGANVTNDNDAAHMHYTSLPFETWNTQKVTDMSSMFKGAKYITTLKPLEKWKVSNLASTQQMFFRTNSLTDATDISGWNVVRVGQTYSNAGNNGASATGSFNQMFGRSGVLSNNKLPDFSEVRSGDWNTALTNGGYTPDNGPATGSADTFTITPSANEQTSSNSGWVKNGNTWTYEFTVANDGSKYSVWEDDVPDYDGSATLNDPLTEITKSATITNTNRNQREIDITKIWDDIDDSKRPSNIKVHLKNTSNNTEKVSENSKWIKSGNTWTYKFYVYDNDNYVVYEEKIDKYNSDATENSPMNVVNNTATITNSYKTYDITLKTGVTGNLADINKEFEYKITLYDENGNLLTGNINVDGETITLINGSFSKKLKHSNQTVINNIPIDYKYKIQQTTTNYTTSYNINDNQKNGNDTGIITINNNQKITFINNLESASITGIFTNIKPYLLLLVISIFGLGYIFVTKKIDTVE